MMKRFIRNCIVVTCGVAGLLGYLYFGVERAIPDSLGMINYYVFLPVLFAAAGVCILQGAVVSRLLMTCLMPSAAGILYAVFIIGDPDKSLALSYLALYVGMLVVLSMIAFPIIWAIAHRSKFRE